MVSEGKFERNICEKIIYKLGGEEKAAYNPNFFRGEGTNELIKKVLIRNKDFSSILTSRCVKAGNRRAVEHTFAIFEVNKQIGYENGEDINKVLTLCVAQALEILPRAVCKGVNDNNTVISDNLEYYGYDYPKVIKVDKEEPISGDF